MNSGQSYTVCNKISTVGVARMERSAMRTHPSSAHCSGFPALQPGDGFSGARPLCPPIPTPAAGPSRLLVSTLLARSGLQTENTALGNQPQLDLAGSDRGGVSVWVTGAIPLFLSPPYRERAHGEPAGEPLIRKGSPRYRRSGARPELEEAESIYSTSSLKKTQQFVSRPASCRKPAHGFNGSHRHQPRKRRLWKLAGAFCRRPRLPCYAGQRSPVALASGCLARTCRGEEE
jgi:hypothetical protein